MNCDVGNISRNASLASIVCAQIVKSHASLLHCWQQSLIIRVVMSSSSKRLQQPDFGDTKTHGRTHICCRPMKRLFERKGHGDPGPKGALGLPGEPGMAGKMGNFGSVGLKGEQGGDGLSGEPGPPGPLGPAGSPGSPGPPGVSGEAGPRGDTGDRGLQGARGLRGARGEAGSSGAQGQDGAKGPFGEQVSIRPVSQFACLLIPNARLFIAFIFITLLSLFK
ncbi:unnamed protein product [Protopolystoma xenopodis]|uniref:Collagen IV NC1 domain-containing protein n=1 Tax=Protopolystoma xenopodis TaxID=117903 RepID=A0A448WSE2_9PLAT|nr:unnamed protein product [Protopolystoma xenopodis]